MIALCPFAQQRFEVTEFEEIMFRLFGDWRGAGNGGNRIFQFGRVIGATADFTTIPVLIGGVTFWTFTTNKPIRQKHFFYRIVCLADDTAFNMSGGTVCQINLIGQLTIFLAVGAVVIIKANGKVGEISLMLFADFGN